jgi:hypothetical protein
MRGKWRNPIRFRIAQAMRAVLRAVLRTTIRWRPLDRPQPGYTIVIGCKRELPVLLDATLLCLSKQDLSSVRRTLAVFDCRPTDSLIAHCRRLAERYPQLHLEPTFYSPWQCAVAQRVNLPWVYCWLSWMIGLRDCQTRHMLIHDLDAMLLDADLLEPRYRKAVASDAQWFGEAVYHQNGVVDADGVVTTWELLIDAAFVRDCFTPIDLFHNVKHYKGRSVDFDITLWAQLQAGRSAYEAIDREKMVHPTQVIQQYTNLIRAGRYRAPARNNLPFLPYFMHIGGDDTALMDYARRYVSQPRDRMPFMGAKLDMSQLTDDHVRWITVQIERIERALFGRVRDDVTEYLAALATLPVAGGFDSDMESPSPLPDGQRLSLPTAAQRDQ